MTLPSLTLAVTILSSHNIPPRGGGAWTGMPGVRRGQEAGCSQSLRILPLSCHWPLHPACSWPSLGCPFGPTGGFTPPHCQRWWSLDSHTLHRWHEGLPWQHPSWLAPAELCPSIPMTASPMPRLWRAPRCPAMLHHISSDDHKEPLCLCPRSVPPHPAS